MKDQVLNQHVYYRLLTYEEFKEDADIIVAKSPYLKDSYDIEHTTKTNNIPSEMYRDLQGREFKLRFEKRVGKFVCILIDIQLWYIEPWMVKHVKGDKRRW